jgi:hypothetical protein
MPDNENSFSRRQKMSAVPGLVWLQSQALRRRRLKVRQPRQSRSRWKIQLRNTRARLITGNRSPGPVSPAKWTQRPIMAKRVTAVLVDSLVARRLLPPATPVWAALPRSHLRERERMSPSIISPLKSRMQVRWSS